MGHLGSAGGQQGPCTRAQLDMAIHMHGSVCCTVVVPEAARGRSSVALRGSRGPAGLSGFVRVACTNTHAHTLTPWYTPALSSSQKSPADTHTCPPVRIRAQGGSTRGCPTRPPDRRELLGLGAGAGDPSALVK